MYPSRWAEPSAASVGAEGMPQVVEAPRLIETGGGEGLAEATQDRGLAQRPARVGVGEHQIVLGGLPDGLVGPVQLASDSVGHRDRAGGAPRLGVPNWPRT
jgi:hypothetical protein